MKIAHLLPSSVKFPLAKHNGRYDWALRLGRLQAMAGHEVTFYAASGSTDDSSIVWRSLKNPAGDKRADNLELIKNALGDNHDIYHSHFDYLHYLVSENPNKPLVFTQHWFPNRGITEAARNNVRQNIYAVPPTKFMYEEDHQLGISSLGPIPHGIDLDVFKPGAFKDESRLIFVGRISPRKGVLEAVRLAREAGAGLDIAGKINDSDKGYWKQIEPLVDGQQIRYLGPKKQAEVVNLFQQASAFLFPSQEAEAFGIVTIEAQACGTPVIISDIGASDEMVASGKTGFIANTKEQYLDSIRRVEGIDRSECRKFAEQFDIKKMAHRYSRLYETLVSGQR